VTTEEYLHIVTVQSPSKLTSKSFQEI